MARHDDYIYLRAWNRLLGSDEKWNLRLAREQKAPEDAIFHRGTEGGWTRASDDMNPETRKRLEALVEQMRGEAWRKDDSYDEQGVKIEMGEPKGEKPRCPYCGGAFNSRHAVEEHVKKMGGMGSPTHKYNASQLPQDYADYMARLSKGRSSTDAEKDRKAVQKEHGDLANRRVPATVGNTTMHMKPIPPVREGPRDKTAELVSDLRIERDYKARHEGVDRSAKNFMERQDDESRGEASNRAGRFARENHARLDREEAREKRTPLIFRKFGWDYLHSSKSKGIANESLLKRSKVEDN